ncbi:hypothetical protein CT0861_06234, partial [Colletotrichum tofieldiae]
LAVYALGTYRIPRSHVSAAEPANSRPGARAALPTPGPPTGTSGLGRHETRVCGRTQGRTESAPDVEAVRERGFSPEPECPRVCYGTTVNNRRGRRSAGRARRRREGTERRARGWPDGGPGAGALQRRRHPPYAVKRRPPPRPRGPGLRRAAHQRRGGGGCDAAAPELQVPTAEAPSAAAQPPEVSVPPRARPVDQPDDAGRQEGPGAKEHGHGPQLPPNLPSPDHQPTIPAPPRCPAAGALAVEPRAIPHVGRRLGGAAGQDPPHCGRSRWRSPAGAAGAAGRAPEAAGGIPVDPGRGQQEAVQGQRPDAVPAPDGRGDHRRRRGPVGCLGQEAGAAQARHGDTCQLDGQACQGERQI